MSLPVKHHTTETQDGFSLLEVLVYLAILPLIAIAGFSLVDAGNHARTLGSSHMKLNRVIRTSLRRIHDELMPAGKIAEDKNQNDVLDTGEDLNGNGRLDDDWAVTSNSITFNRRTSTNWSPPISYSVVNKRLIRTQMDLNGKQTSVPIATGVKSFAVSESNGEVTITLTVQTTPRGSKTLTVSGSIQVELRN